jgi:hypothetical protein
MVLVEDHLVILSLTRNRKRKKITGKHVGIPFIPFAEEERQAAGLFGKFYPERKEKESCIL